MRAAEQATLTLSEGGGSRSRSGVEKFIMQHCPRRVAVGARRPSGRRSSSPQKDVFVIVHDWAREGEQEPAHSPLDSTQISRGEISRGGRGNGSSLVGAGSHAPHGPMGNLEALELCPRECLRGRPLRSNVLGALRAYTRARFGAGASV